MLSEFSIGYINLKGDVYMNYNILIGGAAGQGMNSLTNILNLALKRHGYYVFTNQVYMSRIRGGHNFFQIRFSDTHVYTHHPELSLIIALDKLTIQKHQERLSEQGVIICDEKCNDGSNNIISIDAVKISNELNHIKGLNIILLGAFVKLFNLNLDIFREIITEKFKTKSLEKNINSLEKGYLSIQSRFSVADIRKDKHMIINGNTAIALGAIASGLGFYSAYPMTPATSIMSYLNKQQKEVGVLVEQAEDEIAAIHMAIGASFAGARSMTASSGGGISLMVEALGLTSVAEIPLVIVDVQRPGPATGMATKTSQSDLSFLISASQDEIPRMIISVKDQEDAFYQTVRAFELADKYQMLVILLNDEYLADSSMTIPVPDLNNINTNRYLANLDDIINDLPYKRFKFTESGVSPRVIPSQYEVTVTADSHEHDEYGRVVEDADNRTEMHDKRLRKLVSLKNELQEPEYIGIENPEYILIGFGSTLGSIKEAVKSLNADNISIGALVFGDVFPLPQNMLSKYKTCKLINVELNATGQLSKLVKMETDISFYNSILKYNGRQIDPLELVNRVKELI